MSAVFAAIICVVTMTVRIPSPLGGYLNLGDGFILIAAWLLPPVYGFAAAGIGSALADLFSGYAVYIPATFIIKGLMAIVAVMLLRLLRGKGNILGRVIGSLSAEILMVAGYFLFEGILYGFGSAVVNIPQNCIQGVFGMVIGCTLYGTVSRIKGSGQEHK